MLNLIFPTNTPANGAGSTPLGAATPALPAGFGVMVETATGTATVDAAALVTGAVGATLKTGQTAVPTPLPFLGAGLQTSETLIPEGTLATDLQMPETDVALPASTLTTAPAEQILAGLGSDAQQTTAQPMLAGQMTPEIGAKPGTAELMANPAQILAETDADHPVVAAVAAEPSDVQITMSVIAQTALGKAQITTPTSGPQPQPAIQTGTVQIATPEVAALPNATVKKPSANLNATAQAMPQSAAPTAVQQSAPNVQTPQVAHLGSQHTATPKQPTPAATVVQTSEEQAVQIKADLAQPQTVASPTLAQTLVEKQSVAPKSEVVLKTPQTSVPAQAAPFATESTPKAPASLAPDVVTATPTGPTPGQPAAQPTQAAPVVQANSPVQANLLQSVETGVTQPAQSDETLIALKSPLARNPAPEVAPKLATTTPAANEGTQTSTTTKVSEPVVKIPASRSEPKLATGVAPSPAVAPITNELAQTVTAPTVADNATKSPAASAPITTIQAVTAQRNLAPEAAPKLATARPAANDGTQTSTATKVAEPVVRIPASTPEPKLATGAAPSPAVAPTTNEQAQTVTAPTAAVKVTKSPATPAPITTMQAVTAQRNLVKPLQAANTGKPTTVKSEVGQPRADVQQPVFETPTGQQSVVQIKAETATATALGPLGATPEALDSLLAPRAEAAPVQGFDPATAAKVAAPQEAAPKAPPKPFAEALISQVKSVEVSEGRTSVSLHPRGLGNIEIEVVTEKDTAAKVVVRVENPAVLQSLRDERDLLAQAIGVSDSSIFEFHDHQPNDPSGGQGDQSQSSGQSGETSVTAETTPQHTDVVGDGQLDILT